jgi:hypothetical protein
VQALAHAGHSLAVTQVTTQPSAPAQTAPFGQSALQAQLDGGGAATSGGRQESPTQRRG